MPHNLDDNLLVTRALWERLQAEADFESGRAGQPWWVVVQRSNARIVSWSQGYEPDIAELLMGEQMVRELNDEIAHGGAWVVAWTDNGTRMVMLWLDADGDVQFPVQIEDDARGIIEVPIGHWIGQADEAWHHWKNLHGALELLPEQTYRRALGEAPLSRRDPRRASEIVGSEVIYLKDIAL